MWKRSATNRVEIPQIYHEIADNFFFFNWYKVYFCPRVPPINLKKIKQEKGGKGEETEKEAANDFTGILLKYSL